MSTETNKLIIAIEFLETASVLWKYETNYFSSIHLAAAAEEISGKMCRISGKQSNFDDIRANVKKTLSELGMEYTEKQLRDAAYKVKNSIKHMDSENDKTVKVDARKEALEYISSAYQNFLKLELSEFLSETVKNVANENQIVVDGCEY